MKTKPVIYRNNWFEWNRVWLLFLKPFLHSNNFIYCENQAEIKIPIRFGCMIRSLDLDREEYQVGSPRCWLFNDYIIIKIDKTKNKIIIESNVLKKWKEKNSEGGHNVDGKDSIQKSVKKVTFNE